MTWIIYSCELRRRRYVPTQVEAGEAEIQLHQFSALDWAKWSTSLPNHINPVERTKVLIEEEPLWDSGPILAFWRREKSFVCA